MMNPLSTGPIPLPRYALSYGLRLEQGTVSEFTHPHVPVLLPDGSMGDMTLHVMNGTVDEIKAQLLRSIDAFFEIYADLSRSTSES